MLNKQFVYNVLKVKEDMAMLKKKLVVGVGTMTALERVNLIAATAGFRNPQQAITASAQHTPYDSGPVAAIKIASEDSSLLEIARSSYAFKDGMDLTFFIADCPQNMGQDEFHKMLLNSYRSWNGGGFYGPEFDEIYSFDGLYFESCYLRRNQREFPFPLPFETAHPVGKKPTFTFRADTGYLESNWGHARGERDMSKDCPEKHERIKKIFLDALDVVQM